MLRAWRAVAVSAAVVLLGAIASGPFGIWLVNATHPQPPWQDAARFAAAYHPIQSAPYYFGFLLVGGFVGLVSTLHVLAPAHLKPRSVVAVPLASAFAAMVFLNYTLQTTFVPVLVTTDAPGNAALIGALTMANPQSLGWALEMWGYAVLGAATWLVAPVFSGTGLERLNAWLFVANGPVSVAGGIATAVSPGWVLLPAGFVAFGLWNVLVVAMAVVTIIVMKKRMAAP